jgi:hypothetical protein
MKEWIYENDLNNTVRYILGTKGSNPLICIGINPSTAEPENLDETLKSVERRANYNGFDSWIMLNVYPYRATDPDELPSEFNVELHQRNLFHIKTLLKNKQPTIWAAWGALVNKRPYLKTCARGIFEITQEMNCKWVMFGKPTKEGHPHHPLYVDGKEAYSEFPAEDYFSKFP